MIPVNLPKEVLCLFPNWEYRCPNCFTYVEEAVSFCDCCKTVFNEESWRVPPRFLESAEAMSDYAHNVLAPKLTPEKRRLLFQYFTEFFNDGFETGNFSAWTSTTTNGGSTMTVSSDTANDGSYSAKAASLQQVDDWAYVYKSVSPVSEAYMRYYVNMPAVFSANDGHNLGGFYHSSAWIAYVVRNQNSGKWGIYNVVADTINYEPTTTTFSANKWYCVELHVLVNSGSGVLQLWIDGVLKVDLSGQNTGSSNITLAVVGCGISQDVGEAAARTVYVDSVIVADTYIGPESTQQTFTETWATDSLFKKLGITKTFSVEAALQKRNTPKTFSLDSLFQKSFVIQKQIDVLFKKLRMLETFGVDVGLLKKDVIKSFSVDVRFSAFATYTISKQIDVLLKKSDAPKTFGLDANFGAVEAETYARTFGLDITFAYKVRLPELWLDENGKLVFNISKPYAWVGL